jgi:hypothetical protein
VTARICVVILVIGVARAASAQDGATASIVTRLAPDNVTVRAFRLQSPLRIDGRFDGAVRDMAVTDDQQNQAWNGIWHVKTERFENGWTVEVAIPFKTLRYRNSGPQTWGINLRRLVKWKTEFSYLSLVPAALGTGGISRMASAATVVGLETPAQSKNLELKPYVVAASTTDRNGASPFDNRGDANAGLDFKYGLTRSLIGFVCRLQ